MRAASQEGASHEDVDKGIEGAHEVGVSPGGDVHGHPPAAHTTLGNEGVRCKDLPELSMREYTKSSAQHVPELTIMIHFDAVANQPVSVFCQLLSYAC